MESKTQKHMTSLRLPKSDHWWVQQIASKWDLTPAYVYRRAIKEFINRWHESQQ